MISTHTWALQNLRDLGGFYESLDGLDVCRRKRLESPMEIAIAKGLYDVALLLLCNGYRSDLDSHTFSTPLDQALQRRAWDLVEFVLEWGADARTVEELRQDSPSPRGQ